MLPFVDISEDQGNYNMSANTDQLIAIRMSYGVEMRFDNQAAVNYKNAVEAGKRVNFLVRACATRVVLSAAIDDYNRKAYTVRQLLGKKLYD